MFDAMTGTATAFDAAEIEKSDKIEMYRKRREDAVALWATIPEEKFNISFWECGTTCCAIGWLAKMQHDGWSMDHDVGYPTPTHSGDNPYLMIPIYFGLTFSIAKNIFGYMESATSEFYKKNNIKDIKLSDVSRELMAAPYEIYSYKDS